MVLDYSKWDALELSDDSDFEPHPNVDKRSFIRAKQAQIHQQRAQRRHQIETLKYERVINDGLLRRIDTLLTELRNHEAEAKDRNAFIYQALITSAGDPDDDEPPKPPAGIHANEEQPRYSQMMGHLVDQVKQEVDSANHTADHDWYKAFLKGVEGHKKKVVGLQKELVQKLTELEKEESRKITSDSIHDGFNASKVMKDPPKTETKKAQTEVVEVLNPASLKKDHLTRQDEGQSSGADADIEDDKPALGEETDERIEPTAEGKEFGKIKIGSYMECYRFITEHRSVLAEKNTDGLLIAGFHAEEKGNSALARQYVHQALLLQYCRQLGPDGVRLFFKRYVTSITPSLYL
jgi:cell division cycle protein 37